VRTALKQPMGRRIADRVDVREVFDQDTTFWAGETLPDWLTPPQARSDAISPPLTGVAERAVTRDKVILVDDRQSILR